MQTESQRLAEFSIHLKLGDVPKDVRNKAKGHLLDGLGTALAATTFDCGPVILETGKQLSAGATGATAIGSGFRLSPANAALVNGTLAHTLDFDDTHLSSVYHATVHVLAAVLAAGEERGASGAEVLLAFIVGLEVGCRVSAAAQGGFLPKGFHTTGVCGTFASSLASSKLLGLNHSQAVCALGIAGSQASGLLEFGGSWIKRFHAGWAAQSGYISTITAERNFTAATTVFEGPEGFYKAHLSWIPDAENLPSVSLPKQDNEGSWKMLEVSIKPYPCCHLIHAFVDAALFLRENYSIHDPNDIAHINVLVSPGIMRHARPREVMIRPKSSYEAMFSIQYCVALALVKGAVDLSSFHELGVDDPAVLRVAALVEVTEDTKSDFPKHCPGEVKVSVRGNSELFIHRVATSSGTPDHPLSMEQITKKFLSNAGRVMDSDKAQRIAHVVQTLEDMSDVSELVELLIV